MGKRNTTDKKNGSGLLTILLCAALLLAAPGTMLVFLISSGGALWSGREKPDLDPALAAMSASEENTQLYADAQTELPETEPPQTEPPQTEYDPTEGGVHRYLYYRDDCSWNEAFKAAREAGGYLARINSEEEYQFIVKELSEMDLKSVVILQLGGSRSDNGTDYYWVNENNDMYGEAINKPGSWSENRWMNGEPSYKDSYGDKSTAENKMSLYLYEGNWYFNDEASDIVDWYPLYSGKVGYIVEFDN